MSRQRRADDSCWTCAKRHCLGRAGHMVGRLRWAAHATWHARPLSLTARLRLLWHDFVLHALLHRGRERCQDCGRGYRDWHVDNETWQAVMGGTGGLLCPECFGRRSALTVIASQPARWSANRRSDADCAPAHRQEKDADHDDLRVRRALGRQHRGVARRAGAPSVGQGEGVPGASAATPARGGRRGLPTLHLLRQRRRPRPSPRRRAGDLSALARPGRASHLASLTGGSTPTAGKATAQNAASIPPPADPAPCPTPECPMTEQACPTQSTPPSACYLCGRTRPLRKDAVGLLVCESDCTPRQGGAS